MVQGLAHASNMENLRKDIQHVCSGTSDRFVPETSRKSVQANILILIRCFKNALRWEKFWRDQKSSTETELNNLNEEEESRFVATGLNTGLKPTFVLKTAKHGSENLEILLAAVEKILPKEDL